MLWVSSGMPQDKITCLAFSPILYTGVFICSLSACSSILLSSTYHNQFAPHRVQLQRAEQSMLPRMWCSVLGLWDCYLVIFIINNLKQKYWKISFSTLLSITGIPLVAIIKSVCWFELSSYTRQFNVLIKYGCTRTGSF